MGSRGMALHRLPQPFTRKRGSRGSCHVVPWVQSLCGGGGEGNGKVEGVAAESSRRRLRCGEQGGVISSGPRSLSRESVGAGGWKSFLVLARGSGAREWWSGE